MKNKKIIEELKSNIKTSIVKILISEIKNKSNEEIEEIANRLLSEILYNLYDEGGFSIKCGNIEINPIDDIIDL